MLGRGAVSVSTGGMLHTCVTRASGGGVKHQSRVRTVAAKSIAAARSQFGMERAKMNLENGCWRRDIVLARYESEEDVFGKRVRFAARE